MPSTAMATGIGVKHLACHEAGGLIWVAESADAALRTRPSFPEADSVAFKAVSRVQVCL